jgi:hypothetical protein
LQIEYQPLEQRCSGGFVFWGATNEEIQREKRFGLKML